MYESVQQFIYNIIINNLIDWCNLVLFIIIFIIGYCLNSENTKLIIKTILNKIFVALTIVFIIYISIILFLLGSLDFYSYFNLSDVVSLVVFDYFINIFNSYKLSYNYSFIKDILKEIIESLILAYLLNFITTIFKMILLHEEFVFNINTILPDILLIFFIGIVIFPFMYVIAVINEYIEIHSYIKILNSKVSLGYIFKKCNINLRKLYEYKNRLIICDNYLINNFEEYGEYKMFEFNNGVIYQLDKKIGRFELTNSIPKCDGVDIVECFTTNHKIRYVVDYTNDDDYCNVFYTEIGDKQLKLYLSSKKCYPLQVKPILIEYIFKNNIKF